YHALPDRGSLSIGRDETAMLKIDRPWISRSHAILHLGPPLEIEDKGGRNGVRVGARVLEKRGRSPLLPGETVLLGSTIRGVQRRTGGAAAIPALAIDELLGRLDQEIERASKLGLCVDVAAVFADASAEWDVRAALSATHSISLLAVQPNGPFIAASLRRKL